MAVEVPIRPMMALDRVLMVRVPEIDSVSVMPGHGQYPSARERGERNGEGEQAVGAACGVDFAGDDHGEVALGRSARERDLVAVNSRSHVWIARAVAARSRWAVAALAGWSINSRQSEP
jgi:hypothetical protein